jgi:hypothetical protein
MDANDNARWLDTRVALKTIASELAPTVTFSPPDSAKTKDRHS